MKFTVNLLIVKTASAANDTNDTARFDILSSISDDVWHGAREAGAYEWWYFDAVSDNGRDLLVIIFLSNFIFSPRYNRQASREQHSASTQFLPIVPAIAFTWYRDGRPIIRSITEHPASEFTASMLTPSCRIGSSGFHFEGQSKESRYHLEINSSLRRGQTLKASFDWRIIQGDLQPAADTVSLESNFSAATKIQSADNAHEWNMVAPRCNVDGILTTSTRSGRHRTHEFRGTGYHDHNRDTRCLPTTIADWQWGRAHFRNTTAIFYRFREPNSAPVTRLLLVRNGKLEIHPAICHADGLRLHHFGLRYPRQLRFTTNDTASHSSLITLMADQGRVVDGSFFYLRFVGQARLDTGAGQREEAILVSEHLAPRALRWRWLDWLTDMRISRNGRSSFLP